MGPPVSFKQLTGAQLTGTLGRLLVPVADLLRDIRVGFGLRPYRVRMIRTRWSGGRRGVGAESVTAEVEILPVPLLADLTGLQAIVQPVGQDEISSLQLSEISGRYTEEELRGLAPGGAPIGPDEQFYYEVEFLRADGLESDRRRFYPSSAPTYQPTRYQWVVMLERSHEGRARDGSPR